jgi:prephenate dehydratase
MTAGGVLSNGETNRISDMKTIVYQGEPGAFSERAAFGYFGTKIKLVPQPAFETVFSYAERHRGFAIIPIENSVYGSVHANYDLLLHHKLFITGEIKCRIEHHLMTLPGTGINDVKTVYSHPQALGQCSRFLSTLPKVTVKPFYDTAGAAKTIRNDHISNAAAIASLEAARLYQLRVLKKNIENDRQNFTRFLILANQMPTAPKKCKTSLVFAVKNVPGALFKSLAVFSLRDINMLKIESRPILGKPWEYLFYLDIEGSAKQEVVSLALDHLQELTTFVRILGSYPPGKTI